MATQTRRRQFAAKKTYYFGVLTKNSDRTHPEWRKTPSVQFGSFFLQDGCRNVQSWCEKNPQGIVSREPLSFFEEQEDGTLEYMGAGTPLPKSLPALVDDPAGMGDRALPSAFYNQPGSGYNSGMLQDRMEFYERRLEQSDHTATQLLQAIEAKNQQILDAQKREMDATMALQMERLKWQTREETEKEIAAVVEKETRAMRREQENGMGDMMGTIMQMAQLFIPMFLGGDKGAAAMPALPPPAPTFGPPASRPVPVADDFDDEPNYVED